MVCAKADNAEVGRDAPPARLPQACRRDGLRGPRIEAKFIDDRDFDPCETMMSDMPPAAGSDETRMPRVAIAGRDIGSDWPCLVVAEAGVNHNGRLQTALELIDAAVEAGADAVKFPVFRAAELVARGAPTAAYQATQTGHRDQLGMLRQLELADEHWERIKAHCDRRSILFLATPFGESGVARLAAMNVPAIKLASTDLTNRALQRSAAQTGLPLIVSTGASTEPEIREAVDHLRSLGVADRLVLLHCVSCYPTPVNAANLRAIAALAGCFRVPVGFSDHTRSTQVGGWAVAAGACVLEKHVTLDCGDAGPDHAMSLEPAPLGEYIQHVREAQVALGKGVLGATSREDEVRAAARRSIVAAARIPIGTVLTASMLTAKRPGTGIRPGARGELIGRRAAVDIAGDTILAWDMLE